MTTYTDANGEVLELPKLTLKLSEEMEAVPNQPSLREVAKAMYAFVSKVLPKDYLAAVLDGSTVDDVDLVALRNTYDGINNAYTEATESGKMQDITERMESMMPMLDAMEKVVNMSNQAQSRQGFKRVK